MKIISYLLIIIHLPIKHFLNSLIINNFIGYILHSFYGNILKFNNLEIYVDMNILNYYHYAKFEYNNIIIFRNDSNLGPSATRNIGINLAKGDYIAFLDSDVSWHK